MSDRNPMLAYMTPDQRRRESNQMMAEQYNRPTPQDGPVIDRAGLLPLGTYANGQTGIAWPGFVAQPVEAFNRLLQRGYQGGTGDTQGVQDAFDVAGAAMVGGLLAPRPRGSLGMGGRPGAAAEKVRAYRGSNGDFEISDFNPAASNPSWRTDEGALFFGSQDVGNFYGAPQTSFDQQLYSSIVKKHTKPDGRMNPQAIAKEYDEVAPQQGAASVMPADINTSNFGQANLYGYRWDADEGAKLKARIDAAKAQGKDGLIINGMMDASGYPDTQYAVWGRGTVTSPLTGDILYANGGLPGVAVGMTTARDQ